MKTVYNSCMQKFVPFSVFCFSIISLVVCIYSLSLQPSAPQVSFLDVGQGDAIIIDAGNGNQILVDSGRGGAVLKELGRNMKFGDKTIEIMMASHYDLDHIGGFDEILENFHSETLLVNGSEPASKTAQRFLSLIDEKDIETKEVQKGTLINLGNGVYVKVLYPFDNRSVTKGNDGSIALKVFTQDKTFLLTGDASSKIEYKLVSEYGDSLKSDILKLGHHGSKTSSSQIFLETVDPQIAIVSAGEGNQYGHPHQSVLSRLRDLDIPAMYTFKEVLEF
jgi:competence protein ComEC